MSKLSKKQKVGITVGSIAGALVIILLVSFFLLTGSSTRVAFLTVEAGEVQVNLGSGWEQAKNGMALKLDSLVKTGANGAASIVMYESAIVSLAANTEVTIAELGGDSVKVKQNSGSTWNKFTGLSGIKNMEVETPTAVATVRGTSFAVTMDGVLVAEGMVDVELLETGQVVQLVDGQKAMLVDGKLVFSELTPEEREQFFGAMGRHLDVLKSVRIEEIKKHPAAYGIVKTMYSLSDADVQQKLQDIDEGRLNEDELAEQAPVSVESLDKVVLVTKQIKKQMEMMDALLEDTAGIE